MNKRIKTLCQEAFTEAHESRIGPDGLVRSDGNPYIFYEKFAKLIVKECAEQSMSIGRYNTPSGITPDLAIAIAVGLKKHFGVEE